MKTKLFAWISRGGYPRSRNQGQGTLAALWQDGGAAAREERGEGFNNAGGNEKTVRPEDLLGGECLGDVFSVGAGLDEVLSDAGALVGGEGGDGGEDAAQGNGDVVDVVHEADGFTGKGHLERSSIKKRDRNFRFGPTWQGWREC